MSDLQYVIIGAGGTGGGIGAYMAAAGKHVTLIARGAKPIPDLRGADFSDHACDRRKARRYRIYQDALLRRDDASVHAR